MTFTKGEIDSIKRKFSEAYLYAVAAKANLRLQPSGVDYDGFQIDFSIINHNVGLTRSVASESSEIRIQLKGVSQNSESMFRANGDTIDYRITKELFPFGPAFYLVVVHLLDDTDIESWIKVSEDELMLKKCAYYLRIDKPIKPGFVSIPKINLFTPEALPTLFIDSARKENIL